jgi:hypothetical protein
VHDRLHAAVEALGGDACETVRGYTAIQAARKALTLLQWGLVKAVENGSDQIDGVHLTPPPDD